jgi:hypothetical protein
LVNQWNQANEENTNAYILIYLSEEEIKEKKMFEKPIL